MSLDDFIDADQQNLDRIRTLLPHFRELMPQMHELYQRSLDLVPKDALVFGRSLLLCHKSLLSAAAMIGRRHPDDAAAITRRAIETARVALAVKHDAKNLERWKNAEQRLARWAARGQGKRPKPVKDIIQYPAGHAGQEELLRYFGLLSDAFVHFTPEFVETQGWRHQTRGEYGYVELPYLETDQRSIERHLLILGGVHMRIVDILDECFDGALSGDDEWRRRRADVAERGARLGELFARQGDQDPHSDKGER